MSDELSKEFLQDKSRSELVDIAKGMSIEGLFKMDKGDIIQEIHLKSKVIGEIDNDIYKRINDDIRKEIERNGLVEFLDNLKNRRRYELVDIAKSIGIGKLVKKGKDEIVHDIKRKISNNINGADTDKGYIYVMVNSEKEGLVKIGMTEREPEKRAKELSRPTGVALPFVVSYKVRVENPSRVEENIHDILSEYRINPNREFFSISSTKAIRTIESVLEE